MRDSGADYSSYYHSSVVMSRVRRVLLSGYASLTGLSGYSCRHDCGPHGSCRCGVCVTGGNQLNCDLPHCGECSGSHFVIFLFIFIPFCVMAATLFYAVLKVLVVSSKFSQEAIQDILGYRCCLFNKNLFRMNAVPRKYKSFLSRIFFIYQLPPYVLIVFSVVVLLIQVITLKMFFSDSVSTVYSILPEELFPSDHSLVYASVVLQWCIVVLQLFVLTNQNLSFIQSKIRINYM